MEKNTHRKYHNSNGEEVPSVTTVLRIFHKELSGWANSLGFRGINVKKYLEERALYGTNVHKVCECFFNDEPVDSNVIQFIGEATYERILEKLAYLKEILSEKGYTIYRTELALEGERFGGTIDLLFFNEEKNDYLLLDLKTSKSTYNTMLMQLSAYTMLLEECENIKVTKFGIILIEKETSDPNFSNIWKVESNLRYQSIFIQLLNIYYNLTDNERQMMGIL